MVQGGGDAVPLSAGGGRGLRDFGQNRAEEGGGVNKTQLRLGVKPSLTRGVRLKRRTSQTSREG
jgi:hypothetical protein